LDQIVLVKRADKRRSKTEDKIMTYAIIIGILLFSQYAY